MDTPGLEAGRVDLDAMLADIGELVRCESPSADPVALRASAELVAALGTRLLGEPPELIDTGATVHVRWRLGTGAPRVLILGHHDTVWPIGTITRSPFAVAAGRMTGPGCFDMKAGVAMMLHAVAGLDRRDGLSLLVTGDEELGSPGSRSLIEAEAARCRAALVLEAAAGGGALKTERKGVSRYEIVVAGRAAHAGLEPELGVNAAVELAHHAIAIAALADPVTQTTVVPTMMAAGTTANTVPAAGRLHVDVRAWTVEEQERVDRALRSLTPRLDGAALRVEGGINRPPLTAGASEELFARAQRIAGELGIPIPGRAAVGGGSDGNFTAGIGVPTLDGLGAVGGGAHAEGEHVEISQLAGRTLLVRSLIAELLTEAVDR